MNTWSIVFIVIGIIYLIYSILFRNDVTMYIAPSTEYYINNRIYVKIQLITAIINSIILILGGILIRIFKVNYACLMAFPLIFIISNIVLYIISKRRGYIKKYLE